MVFLMSASTALAQDFCKGDFDYDGDVDAVDVAEFMNHFGRSQFNNPCPPDGPTPPPKTGQTTSYATGDDGDLESGVALVTPRFTDNLDGTVTDNQTGLIWMQDANCFGFRKWNNGLSDCNGLSSGVCGLSDGSNAGDWRLPNYKELISLVAVENYDPALPTGHPFTNVQSFAYWTSSTLAIYSGSAWGVEIDSGHSGDLNKDYNFFHVWCVRGGH